MSDATQNPPSTSLLRSPWLPAALVLAVGVPSYALFIVWTVMSDGLVFPNGGIVGGDFVAFWTAARAVLGGGYPGIYDASVFEAALHGTGADHEHFGLTWQYPPHAMLLYAPLAMLPYMAGYAAFTGLGLAAFAGVLRGVAGVPWRVVGLILLSSPLFHVVVCGQAGTYLGALMLAALLLPDRRPLVAGVCAGVLTIKPQLGVLIPIAYAAGGHWRAFGAAATTGVLLVAGSLAVFGTEAWSAFFAQILGVTEMVGDAVYPLHKMVTVFAALRQAGLPEWLAAAGQGAAFVFAVWACWTVWRGARPLPEKAAITTGLAFLCTPYAYFYDTAVLALAFLIAGRGVSAETPARLAALGLVFFAPVWMLGAAAAAGGAVGVGAVLLLTLMVARPDLLRTRVLLGSPAAA